MSFGYVRERHTGAGSEWNRYFWGLRLCEGLRSFSANRRRTVSRETPSCSVSLAPESDTFSGGRMRTGNRHTIMLSVCVHGLPSDPMLARGPIALGAPFLIMPLGVSLLMGGNLSPKPPPSRAELQAKLEEARQKYRKFSNAAALPNLTPQEAARARSMVRSAAAEVILGQKALAIQDEIDSANRTISTSPGASNPAHHQPQQLRPATNSVRAMLRGIRRTFGAAPARKAPVLAEKARAVALTAADGLKGLRAWMKVFENPLAWLLLALLALAEYGNYQ
jgi:hypothetical protein